MDGLLSPQMNKKAALNLMRALPPPWPAPIVLFNNELFSIRKIQDNYHDNFVKYELSDGAVYLDLKRNEESEELWRKITENIVR